MKNYIFGYGSLVHTHSRSSTGASVLVGPAHVRGLERSWNVQVGEATALGVTKKTEATCNGVIVFVSNEGLEKFDDREVPTKYKRVELPKSNVELLAGGPIDGTLWVYIAIDPKLPDEKHPILQSYVDVVLTGFLDFGIDFAKEFINSTKEWSHFVRDRSNPKYPRFLGNVERKVEIDTLMTHILL